MGAGKQKTEPDFFGFGLGSNQETAKINFWPFLDNDKKLATLIFQFDLAMGREFPFKGRSRCSCQLYGTGREPPSSGWLAVFFCLKSVVAR